MAWVEFETGATAGSLGLAPLPYTDIREFAEGVAVGNAQADTTALDLAFAYSNTNPLDLFMPRPTAAYTYAGVGLDHNPAPTVIAPLRILGAGSLITKINFTTVTGNQAIRIAHQTASIGSGYASGGGISNLSISMLGGAATKNAIVLQNVELVKVSDLYVFQGGNAITINEARNCRVDSLTLDRFATNGVNYIGDSYSGNWLSFISMAGAATSNMGFNYVRAGTIDVGEIHLLSVKVTVAGNGAFNIEGPAGTPAEFFLFATDCHGDGTFPFAWRFKNCDRAQLKSCWATAHGTGGSSTHGVIADNAKNIHLFGGNLYGEGASGSNIAYYNACDRIRTEGVRLAGTTMDYRAGDATTHTNIYWDNPKSLATTESNDLTKFQFGIPKTVIHRNTTQVSTDADTNPKTLWSFTLPAGKLHRNGQYVQITVYGSTAANGNTKMLQFVVDATTLTINSATTAPNDARWVYQLKLQRVSATSILRSSTSVFGSTNQPVANATITQDLSLAVPLSVVGTNAIAAANDIVFYGADVEFSP